MSRPEGGQCGGMLDPVMEMKSILGGLNVYEAAMPDPLEEALFLVGLLEWKMCQKKKKKRRRFVQLDLYLNVSYSSPQVIS